MHYYYLISVIVPGVLLCVLPHYFGSMKYERTVRWRLYVASALFFVSWYLPSFLIDGQDTSFTTHFVGGGMFTAFLWWYTEGSLGMSWKWYMRLGAAYALVSALGNINELYELFMVRSHLANILITDTSWDILANTLGMTVAYGCILLITHRGKHRSRP